MDWLDITEVREEWKGYYEHTNEPPVPWRVGSR
jgi:hypothetical protein